jgi:16S rRNA (uracil1498-N3)-methyltransferase
MTRIKRFFIEQGIRDRENIRVQGNELHHMIHVLRLQVGEMVEVFDGSGKAYLAEISDIQRKSACLRIKESLDRRSESFLTITLLQSSLKMDRMEWIIQKTTELGVFEIQPIASLRSVIQKDAMEKRRKRWQRIANEAAKQSTRLQSPRILDPLDFEKVPDLKPGEFGILLHSSESSRTLSQIGEELDEKKILIMVGPEGGWDPLEVALAQRKGFVPVSLGPRILRSETAGIVAVALIQFLAGDMDH